MTGSEALLLFIGISYAFLECTFGGSVPPGSAVRLFPSRVLTTDVKHTTECCKQTGRNVTADV